jgi:hypothetical protein
MRRTLLILVSMGIIAVLAVVAISNLRDASPRVVQLPNGMQVQVLGTAIGMATFTTEKSWHRQARKILPARLQNWIPSPTSGSCSGGTNSLTVYVRVIDPTGAAITGQPWEQYGAQGDDGSAYQREGGGCSMGGGSAPMEVHGLILRSYPRRQSRFKLHLFDAKGAVLAKLDVENPVRGPFPEWRPSPLPQTQSNGPVTLTLEGLQEAGSAPYRYISPKWSMTSTDAGWSKARVRYLNLIDSTGNEGQWLSRREKVWMLRAQMYRESLQDFAPAEYVAFTNVAIPEAGKCIQPGQAVERNGVRLLVHAIAGAGAIANTNGTGWQMLTNASGFVGHSTSAHGRITIEKWGSRTPFILLEARNVQDNDDIRFELHDDLGRSVNLDDSHGYGLSNGGRLYLRGFTPPEGASSLTLEIVVNRPLQFEFLVNPAAVNTPKE